MADVTTTFAAKDESFAKTVDNLKNRLQGFQGETQTFSEKVASMASQFAKVAGPIAAIGAAFLGAKSMASAFVEAIQMGGKLNDLSARTGESAGNLAILQRAFDNAGASADQVGPIINRLQRNIVEAGENAEGPAASAFKKLGLSFEEVKEMTPTEQLRAVAAALQQVTNDSDKTAIAQQLLGKSGGELIPLLKAMEVELANAQRQLGSYPEIINQTSSALDTIGDNFGAISAKAREFASGLLVNLAPGLAEITTKIAEIDAAGFGMMLSDYFKKMMESVSGAFRLSEAINSIKASIEAITSGNFGEGLSLMWVTMKVTALNALNEIVNTFTAGFMTIKDFIAEMFSSNGALYHLMTTLADLVANKFVSAIGLALADMVAAMGPAFEAVAEAIKYNAETAARKVEMLTFGMGAQFSLVAEQAAEAGAAMPENFEKNKASLSPLFDLTDVLTEQARLHESIESKLSLMQTSTEGIAEHSQEFANAMARVDVHMESSSLLSSQIRLNLEASNAAALDIPNAFELGSESSAKISTDLNNTADSAQAAEGWIGKAEGSASDISIHGNAFQTSASEAAQEMQAAKGDAKLITDIMTGPQGLTQKFNEAMSRTKDLRDVIDKFIVAGKDVAQSLERAARLDQDARQYERNEDRAHNLRERGYDKSANQVERNAQSKFIRDNIKEQMRQTAEDAKARAYERAEDASSLREALDIKRMADNAYRKTMEELSRLTKEELNAAATGIGDGGEEAKSSMKSGGQDASSALKDAASAVRQALGGARGQGQLALEGTLQACRDFLNSIDKKLPQNALSP